MIVDVHTHSFPERIAEKAIPAMSAAAKTTAYTKGTDAALSASMDEAGIDISVLLPVATNSGQVEKLNNIAIEKNEAFCGKGLFSLGCMHPEYEDYKNELSRIKDRGLTGIKLHPAYQDTDLDDKRYLRIIDRASELGLAVMVHAGLDIGIMPHNFSSVGHICTVLKEIAPRRFVLAHMGGWKGWNEVESTLCGENVYLDTSFSLERYEVPDGMFVPEEETRLMSDEQFLRILKKHGADKILFGTDSPWSDQKKTLEHIKRLVPDEKEQALILSENAFKVFSL
ncbi:MAG: amidohydrolase family protein [Eubacterium sp.]|nr:amidohydrolase family protein [Eubacterium sp.]